MARIASTTSAGVPVDPTGGMTLDALMARAKEAAARQGQIAQPRNMQSPMQGLAQMAQAFVAARQGAHAEDQVAQGRAQLAQIMGGIDPVKGATPDQLSQSYALDPDLGLRLMESSAAAVRAARQRQQELDDRAEGRTYAAGVTADTRKYEEGQLAGTRTYEAGQEAAIDTRELAQAQAAAAAARAQEGTVNERERLETIEAEKRAALALADKEKRAAALPSTPQGKAIADYQAGNYGPVGSPEAMQLRDKALAKENTTSSGGPQGLKILYDQQDQYIGTQSAIGQLSRARDLLKQGINTGYTAGVRTMYGAAGGPGGDPQSASRTKEYNSIMRQEAIAAMSTALKGATTDTEMQEFITNMNDPTLDPDTKGRMIDTMLAKATAFNEQQALRIKAMDPNAELPQVKPRLDPEAEAALLQGARDVIAKGANADLVKKRLVDKGADPGKL